MTTVTALETQAGQVLDQSYAQFKQAQLALDEEIAQQVIKLQDQVLPTMYQQGQSGEFLKLNFTGNDIRWLLGLPRTHHRQRISK